MDKKILHRFFMGTASFEEEKAVCKAQLQISVA